MSTQRLMHLHTDCEVNYARLSQLMPAGQTHRLFAAGRTSSALLYIEKLDSARFTRFYKIETLIHTLPWGGRQQLSVRVYDDAKMVEVTAIDNKPLRYINYVTPNQQMFSSDEKLQTNRLLSTWLLYFAQHGRLLQSGPSPLQGATSPSLKITKS